MDVTKENFSELLPQILSTIKSSAFIALDTEFTGLLTDDAFKRSYFDSGTSLYEKDCKNFTEVSICQLGISCFKGIIDSNAYNVETYNFFICPHSILTVDENVLFQVSSLEFLKQYKFNFSKWLNDGIPCLNEEQEKEVRMSYSDILSGSVSVQFPYEVLDEAKNIRFWLKSAELDDTVEVTLSSPTHILLFFAYAYSTFSTIVATYKDGKIVVSTNYSAFRDKIMKEECENVFNFFIENLKGFVQIFKSITEAKVPCIFHNGMIDLMLIYKQFYRSLPKKYQDFKTNTHYLFPQVYDTKRVCSILYGKFKTQNDNVLGFLGNSTLGTVKTQLENREIVLHRPTVIQSNMTPKYMNGASYLHEAGYDAFCTGYCFIHLAHIFSMLQYEKIEYQRPMCPREHIYSLKQWMNEIPLSRAGINYMSLDGENPELKTISWLVIESKNPFKVINPADISSSLSSFGTFDIIRRNNHSVMVATPRAALSREIMRMIGENKHFKITKYNAFKHSKMIRSIAWSCALVSTGISTFIIVNIWKKFSDSGNFL